MYRTLVVLCMLGGFCLIGDSATLPATFRLFGAAPKANHETLRTQPRTTAGPAIRYVPAPVGPCVAGRCSK